MSNIPKNEGVPINDLPFQAGKIVVGKPSHKLRNIILIVAGVLLLGLAGGAVWYFTNRSSTQSANVAFTIGSQTYTKQEINNLIEYPVLVGISKNDAAKQAFDMYKRKAAADKTGIVIDASAIEAERKVAFPNYSENLDVNTKNWIELVSYDSALTKISSDTSVYTNAQGYIYIFWFGRSIVYEPSAKTSTSGSADVITSDRKYAQERTDFYHQQLESGTMKPEDVLMAIKADVKLGMTGRADNISLHFDSISNNLQANSDLLYIPDYVLARVIEVSHNMGLDSIKTGTTENADYASTSGSISQSASAETFFYFIDIDKAATSSYNMSNFKSNLESISSDYRGIG